MLHDIDELIVKKIQGSITHEELNYLESWCKEDPAHRVAFEKVVQYWNVKEAYGHSKQYVWQNLQQEILQGEGKGKPSKTAFRIFFHPISKVAASIAILIIGYLALQFGTSTGEESHEQVAVVKMLEKVSPLGSKLSLRLPDGTSVKLNSGSMLKFPERFEGKTREVYLEGEAFFDVAHDASNPFIIHTEHIDTQVLGTSFNVKADDSAVQVVVVTGKVRVANTESGEQVVLPPNKMATYEKASEVLEANEANQDLLAWKDGIIVFNKAPFKEVEETLHRWYGVEFVNEKKVSLPGGFTARFKNQSLSDILESIAYAGEFKFQIEGKRVRIF